MIDELLRREATFAAFRLPSQQTMVYVQRAPRLHQPRAGQGCFVLAPFDPIDGPPMCVQAEIIISTDTLGIPWDEIGARPPSPVVSLEPNMDRPAYRDAVKHAIDLIRSEALQKVVLARTIEVELLGISPGALFEAAALSRPDAFIAIARTDHFGLWMGASPERLLIKRGEHIEADALAGTMPIGTAPPHAHQWGAKEQEEQELVVRMVGTTLTAKGVLALRMEGPRVHHAGSVAHLRTTISGNADKADALDLAQALHPTPAVAGSPREAAMDLIRLSEWRNRSLYAGYWGPMDAQNADLFVNIRCMEIAGERALLHVGAGITRGSDPDRECEEVERKSRTWLDLIEAQRAAG